MKARFLNSQGTLFVIFVNNNSYCLNIRNLLWWSNIIIQNYYFEGNCHLLQSEFKESSFHDSISKCNHEKKVNFIMINNWHNCSKINPQTYKYLLFIWTLNNSKARISFYTNFKMAFNINALSLSRISFKVLFHHSRHVQHSTKTNSILGRVYVQWNVDMN